MCLQIAFSANVVTFDLLLRVHVYTTSITKTQDMEPERRHHMTSRAGDLLSSAHLDKRQSVRTRRQSKGYSLVNQTVFPGCACARGTMLNLFD